ncbi:uncharacterized protein LOC130676776 isoform X1 [Microplitis mediator]|uniref:uncharacterized protein LOC130676776 isoform X1 n=1 Tax=Microplitis mediator TaxID=375433 RepID=UPI00255515D7|nr:uncharacterized protein LOC130676776 isoform X1 [Microplitis mediator]
MKVRHSICLLLTFFGAFALVSKANAKYDNVPQAILKRYLPHIDCLLDRKPCDFYGKKAKALMPDWFKNECANCDFMIKTYAKEMIPEVQKYFPDDWQLIKQKYGGQSSVQKIDSNPAGKVDDQSEFKIIPTYLEPSIQHSQYPGHKYRPGTPVSKKPTSQISVTDVFSNNPSYGAKAVICLVEKKGCDPMTQYFKLSMYQFIKTNQCVGCEVPKVFKWYTDMKNFLAKNFPRVLRDIIATGGL